MRSLSVLVLASAMSAWPGALALPAELPTEPSPDNHELCGGTNVYASTHPCLHPVGHDPDVSCNVFVNGPLPGHILGQPCLHR